MSRRQDLLNDPVVEEVRAIREKMVREAGGTIDGLLRLIRESKPVRTSRTGSREGLGASRARVSNGRARPKRGRSR